MKTYEISPFWKYLSLIIFYSIYFGALYFLYPIYSETEMNMFLTAIIPLIYLYFGIFVYSYIESQFSLIIVIDDEKIRQENDNIYREWYFNEFRGYRLNNNILTLVPKNSENKNLNLSLIYDNYEELEEWILSRYKNLDKKDSISPSIGIAFIIIPTTLLLSSVINSKYNILDYSNSWLYTSIVAFVILLIYFINEDFKKLIQSKYNSIVLLAITLLFSFGAIHNINIIHNNVEERYSTKILNKEQTSGRNSYNKFTLDIWQHNASVENVNVNSDLYYQKTLVRM